MRTSPEDGAMGKEVMGYGACGRLPHEPITPSPRYPTTFTASPCYSQPQAAVHMPFMPRSGCGIKQRNFSGPVPVLRN